MSKTPDAVVRAWFDELWNQGKEETIDRLLAVDALAHGLSADGTSMRGRDAFRPFFKTFKSAFPDLRVEVMRTVTEGDTVAALCHVTGCHQGHDLGCAATGKNVDFWGMSMTRIRDGQIVEGWNTFDFLALYQQVGLMPML